MSVTSAQAIRDMAMKEVEIKGFEEGETITIRLKNLSLLGLVKSGKIPNQLLGTAVELFEGKKDAKQPEQKAMDDMASLIDLICENAMVEPTFAEVGEFLNDGQKMEIFYFTQGGLKALNSFREIQAAK